MSQGSATFILMNNYFHDVATAMLLACSIVLWVMLRQLGGERDGVLARYAAALFRRVTAMFWFSVVWIAASGIVRIVTFREFEWFNTTQKHFEVGLFVKYGIAVVMMIAGSFLWAKVSQKMKQKIGA